MDGNQVIADRSIRYAVFLERYKAGVTNRISDLLFEADEALVDQLLSRLGRLSDVEIRRFGSGQPLRSKRGREFAAWLRQERGRASEFILDTTLDEVLPVAQLKTERSARDAVSIGLTLNKVSNRRIRSAFRNTIFQGRVLGDWAAEWSDNRRRRVVASLRQSFATGASVSDAVKTLRGDRVQNFRNGVLNVSRRGARTLVRTSFNHMVSQADVEQSRQNADLIDWVVWTSTLDSRTSDICRSNDGRRFRPLDTDYESLLPAHPNCRSTWRTIYKGMGQSPAPKYYDWLKEQPGELVEEALGPTRAKLFLEGGLTERELIRDATTGQPWNLDELREREAAAFDRAGL